MNKNLLEDIKTTRALKEYLTELSLAYKSVTGVFPTNERLVAAVNNHFGFQILEFKEHWNKTDIITDAFLSDGAKCITEDWKQSLWNDIKSFKSLTTADGWKQFGTGTIGGMFGRGVTDTVGRMMHLNWLEKTPLNALGWWMGERAVPKAAVYGINKFVPSAATKLSSWIPKGGSFTNALGAELGMQLAHQLGIDGFWGQLGSGVAGQYGMHKAVQGGKAFLKSPTGQQLVSRGMGALRGVAKSAVEKLARFGANQSGRMALPSASGILTTLGTDVGAAGGGAIAGTALAGAALGTATAYGINRAIGGADYANRQFELNTYNPKTWWEGIKGVYQGAKGLVGLDTRDSQDIAREQQIAAAGERNKQLADQTRDMSPEERGRVMQAEFDRVAAERKKQQTNESTLLEQAVYELFQLNEVGVPHIELGPVHVDPHVDPHIEGRGPSSRSWWEYLNPEVWGNETAERIGRLFGFEVETPGSLGAHPETATPEGKTATPEAPERKTATPEAPETETATPETETKTPSPEGAETEGPLDPEISGGRRKKPNGERKSRRRRQGKEKTEPRVEPEAKPEGKKEPIKPRIGSETETKPGDDYGDNKWVLPMNKAEYPAIDSPPNEKFSARKAVGTGHPVYDPNSGRMIRMSWDPATVITENKLSDNESTKRKVEKQKYKVVYMQNGKKVEVFASSVRGVRRVVYGKNQYRIYDSKGSDVTAYVKKMMSETK